MEHISSYINLNHFVHIIPPSPVEIAFLLEAATDISENRCLPSLPLLIKPSNCEQSSIILRPPYFSFIARKKRSSPHMYYHPTAFVFIYKTIQYFPHPFEDFHLLDKLLELLQWLSKSTSAK